MCSETQEPIYITKNGYGDMVTMSMEVYEKRLWLMDVENAIAEAEEDVRLGKVSDAKANLKALRERYGL